jgi:hypothetical protein
MLECEDLTMTFVIQNSHALFWKGGSDGLCLTGGGGRGGGWALPEAHRPLFLSSARRLTSSQNLFLSSWSLGTRPPDTPPFSSSSSLITAVVPGNGDALLVRGIDSSVRRRAMMIPVTWRRDQLETAKASREPWKKETNTQENTFYSQGTGQLGKKSLTKIKDRARTNKSKIMYNCIYSDCCVPLSCVG